MKTFLADLHIHSRFSRATSKRLNFRNLAAWGSVKGIDLLSTADFTHPGWFEAVKEELEPEEGGIFRLRESKGLETEIPGMETPLPCRTKFILGTEISSIYKRMGQVRKVHNLVFMPDLDSVEKFNRRLGQVGNLAADGRPILGLDSRDLLEMVLSTHPDACLIPAHIWTPWFSVFGSKSGFDRLEDCFGDLTSHIFALETGLSSDPDMNRLLSSLDKYRLISNSDAHSGEKLGREVNLFAGEMEYNALFRSLKGLTSATEFRGTIEFFPEEGKYHLDGHRKCNVVLDPRETRRYRGLCPVCGKPLTIGVLHRVLELADRDDPMRPQGHPGFSSLIPLPEILSEILKVGPKSKKVNQRYLELVHQLGPEMHILRRAPLEDIQAESPLLAEALRRMRAGEVIKRPGYDGAYGTITMFSSREQECFDKGAFLPGFSPSNLDLQEPDSGLQDEDAGKIRQGRESEETGVLLNPEQNEAVAAGPGPVLVQAGPGTGKTFTLVHRVRALLSAGAEPSTILVVTFTRRAAGELRERLSALCPQTEPPLADTMHALAYQVWTELLGEAPVLLSENDARRTFALANPQLGRRERSDCWEEVNLARERRQEAENADEAAAYAQRKAVLNLVDYTDLLEFWIQQVDCGNYTRRFTHVLVDEVQDMSRLQLDVLQRLLPASGQGLFAIGDPRQSIYAFRGADPHVKDTLQSFWSELKTITLSDSHRSGRRILDLASSLFPDMPALRAAGKDDDPGRITMFTAGGARQEAAWIGEKILSLLGGTAHWQADRGQGGSLGPGDICILVRLRQLIPVLHAVLEKMGVPCRVPEKELFFHDPLVASLVDEGRRVTGITLDNGQGQDEPLCPDHVVAAGPEAMAEFLSARPEFREALARSKAFAELKVLYADHQGWAGVFREIALLGELEAVRSKSQKVQIMTLHAAKGLEFDTVFLPALEDGILPLADLGVLVAQEKGARRVISDEQEERRLFFVGLTRASKRVYLSRSQERTLFGRSVRLPMSRFLKELPSDLMHMRRARAHVRVQHKPLKMDL